MVEQVLLSVGLTTEERSPLEEVVADTPGVELACAERMEEALSALRSRPVVCLVTASQLPDGDAVGLLTESRKRWPQVGCILCTDADDGPVLEDGELCVEIVPWNGTNARVRLAQLARVTIDRRTQATYPLPPDEAERLATLQRYRLEDDSLVAHVERLTELAALHFEVPLASVNLVYEQTLEPLACYGGTATTLDRGEVICTHALLGDGPTVIEDISESCCASLDVVEEYDLGFYAGATLRTGDGHALGTFCVYDHTSRQFSTEDRHALELYATEAMAWIDHLGQPPAEQPDTVVGEDR